MENWDDIKRGFGRGSSKLAAVGAAGLLGAALTLSPQTAQAQAAPVINCQGRPVTSLQFQGAVLESGTALQTNAVYRYTNIAPGIDARVQILGFTGGGSLNVFDNDGGLSTYMQPELNTTGTSAADFRISFVDSSNQPVMLDIAASAIDVDGNGNPNGSDIDFDYARDVRYSTSATRPANFGACQSIAPENLHRNDITFICFNPKGFLGASSPDEDFSVSFRALIR